MLTLTLLAIHGEWLFTCLLSYRRNWYVDEHEVWMEHTRIEMSKTANAVILGVVSIVLR